MTAKTSAEYMREWIARPGNREKKQAMNRKYYERIKADGKMTRDNMERNRFRKHGTTRDRFQALIDSQDGGCAICGTTGDWSTLVVDHDHACCPGQFSCGACIRGALCKKCNTMLGLLNDSVERAVSTIAYLTR